MLLGYHTNSLQNHRLDDALDLVAGHGFRAVAITPDTCHLDPDATDDDALRRLRGRLEALDLRPVMETGARFLLDPAHKHEPTLMTADPARREQRLSFYRRVAEMGQRLGAEVVSFWTGIDRAPGPDSADRLRDGVAAACRVIRDEGLRPALEPEPGMALETVAGYLQLRDEMGSTAPDLTLDVGHLYAVWEGDPDKVISSAAPFLAQVHLEDHRRGVHEHLLPGAGEVDFDMVLNALSKAGYRGPACFELSRHSHCAPTALAACRELWERRSPPPRR
ncbi:MAG: sugar phosphate isomerase/epimerase family protein [Planctomycetota bacterium]